MTRLDIADVDEEEKLELLRELQNLSPLHNLVVTGAPLEVVQLVYEHDKSQITKDIFLDACRHNASPVVMEFLKSLLPTDACTEREVSDAMHHIIHERDGHNNQDDRFRVLLSWCPQAARLSSSRYYCKRDSPLVTICESNNTQISEDLIAEIVQSIPDNVKKIDIPIDYRRRTGRQHRVLRAALSAKLKETTALEHLTMQLYHQYQIDRDSRDTICGLFSSGTLEALTVTMKNKASDGFLVPFFNAIKAAGNASNLTKLQIHLVGTPLEVIKFYQDQLIEVLKTNTSLTHADVFHTGCSGTTCRNNDELSGKWKIIKYFNELNRYGRSVMRDPDKSLRDVVEKLAACTSQSRPGLSVLYGLLRDSPGKWSDPVAQLEKEKAPAGNTPNRKRKANSLD
ncbi:expressed unknown protein [Seminavis robusta]|uniref:Uncharacterized protein n=1 Tax=Seminavis robusta TaxID=568900 RepID=A0A9N8EZE3_9STRA|nr:expressed unknown protein [Seminavis robusta]|eukprot:Sro2246_g320560.1 n/a (398) ;mRNA; r:3318-4511